MKLESILLLAANVVVLGIIASQDVHNSKVGWLYQIGMILIIPLFIISFIEVVSFVFLGG